MVNQPPNWNKYTPTVARNSSVVAPAAGQVIVDLGALPAGLYDVTVSGSYGGTADVIDNMALVKGDKTVMTLPVIPVANATIQSVSLPGLAVYEGEHLKVVAITTGAVGSVYRGVIIATPQQTATLV